MYIVDKIKYKKRLKKAEAWNEKYDATCGGKYEPLPGLAIIYFETMIEKSEEAKRDSKKYYEYWVHGNDPDWMQRRANESEREWVARTLKPGTFTGMTIEQLKSVTARAEDPLGWYRKNRPGLIDRYVAVNGTTGKDYCSSAKRKR